MILSFSIKLIIAVALICDGEAKRYPINREGKKLQQQAAPDDDYIKDIPTGKLRKLTGGANVVPPTMSVEVNQDCVNPNEPFTGTIILLGAGGNSSNSLPIEIVLAIDTSTSMEGSKLAAAKRAAIDFMNLLDDSKDLVGVVGWNSNLPPEQAINLTQDFTSVRDKINSLNDEGSTNLDLGLTGAIDKLDGSTFPSGESSKAVIFLSDGGADDRNRIYTRCSDTSSPAKKASDKGYTVYTIGLGSEDEANADADAGLLSDMAECSGGTYRFGDEADLDDIYKGVFQEVIDSTVPYNVAAHLVPAPDIYFFELDSSCSADGVSVENIDEGIGFPDGMDWTCTFSATSSVVGPGQHVLDLASSTISYTESKNDTVRYNRSLNESTQDQVNINEPPIAKCISPIFKADPSSSCVTATILAGALDGGSDYGYDCGEMTPTIEVDKNIVSDGDEVTLTITDSNGLQDTCITKVNVDQIACCENGCSCHGGKKVHICHVPTGNPSDQKTRCIVVSK